MNEPLLQADTQAGESGLWDKAPAWRRLTMVASLLTLAAVATPLLLSQPGDTSLSPHAALSQAAPKVANVQPSIQPSVPPVNPAPAQTASLAHQAAPRPASEPAVHAHIAPPLAQSPRQAEPATLPANPAQPAANPSTEVPADLPVGTIIVSPGELARINQHNRYGQGHDWPITITIISPPAHGTITTRDTTAPLTFNGVTRISTVTQVFYQSQPGYAGMDSFTYKRTSEDPADLRNANTYTMTIDVKK